jgi:hypothetical protein
MNNLERHAVRTAKRIGDYLRSEGLITKRVKISYEKPRYSEPIDLRGSRVGGRKEMLNLISDRLDSLADLIEAYEDFYGPIDSDDDNDDIQFSFN